MEFINGSNWVVANVVKPSNYLRGLEQLNSLNSFKIMVYYWRNTNYRLIDDTLCFYKTCWENCNNRHKEIFILFPIYFAIDVERVCSLLLFLPCFRNIALPPGMNENTRECCSVNPYILSVYVNNSPRLTQSIYTCSSLDELYLQVALSRASFNKG